jgi:hypothetical protein
MSQKLPESQTSSLGNTLPPDIYVNNLENEEWDMVYNHFEALYISQDLDISVMNIDAVPSFDYHVHLNINGDILSANYTDSNSNNGVLTAAHNFNIHLNRSDYMSHLNVNDSYAGGGRLSEENRNFGSDGIVTLKDSLVGVLSKALFDNYGQRAAISDDFFVETEMYDSVNNVLTTIFANDTFQDRMFRRYVASGRYDDDDFNDINDTINYNLTDALFRFGMSFHGLVNERDQPHDTLLNGSLVNILEGSGFHSTGLTITNIQDSSHNIATYIEPAYQFNVLVQLRQTV